MYNGLNVLQIDFQFNTSTLTAFFLSLGVQLLVFNCHCGILNKIMTFMFEHKLLITWMHIGVCSDLKSSILK